MRFVGTFARDIGLIVVVTALLGFVGACGGNAGGYPSNFRSDFLSQCRGSASDVVQLSGSRLSSSAINNYCNCAIDKIQGHYRYDQFSSDPLGAMRYAVGLCQAK